METGISKCVLALPLKRFCSFQKKFSKSLDIKFYPCHYSRAPLKSFKTRSEEADFILLTGKPATSFEQTLFKQIVTGDEVLALVHLFLLKKLLCICTVGFCDQTSS